jgi:RNA polymerase sigma-70 factor (ECF subfamily)
MTPPPAPEFSRMADEDLLSLVEARDADAFEVLYDRHSKVVYSLIYRLLGDRTAAEDVAQETFLAIWRRSASYSASRGSVRTWLLSIAHNQGVDRLRRQSAMARRQEALEWAALTSPGSADVADEAVTHAMATAAKQGLEDLPPEQGQVLTLAYYSGFTQQEIAELLALPLGTVKSRMRLGLDRLRRGLGDMEVSPA